MLEGFNPVRYSVIEEKNKREIVMLRGSGCTWRRCRFCDYHLDCDPDEESNFALNEKQLDKVTGIHRKLEVINSGSFVELDKKTMDKIEDVCLKNNISELHFECHWSQRDKVPYIKTYFENKGIVAKIKIGVETFDSLFRESYLVKGIETDNAEEIAFYFNECCLLQGIPGQTVEMMIHDIETGLRYFERVCINIMQENIRPIKPDPRVISLFSEHVLPIYKDHDRIDILMENTEFGVGEVNILD